MLLTFFLKAALGIVLNKYIQTASQPLVNYNCYVSFEINTWLFALNNTEGVYFLFFFFTFL